MVHSYWTYTGKVDCFGIAAEQRDNIMRQAAQEIIDAGGEVQIRRLRNNFDTDRYSFHISLQDSRPLERMLKNLAALMPHDHPEQEIGGYDHANLQREDLILSRRSVRRRTYQWQAACESAVR